MAHKVHPKVFRIKETAHWNSRWIEKKDFSKNLEEDFRIREFLSDKLKNAGVEKIEIERFPGKINVIIYCARPGLAIGRGGEGIEKLREELIKKILKIEKKKELKLEIQGIKNPWTSATLVSQWIAQQLERRTPYRRVLKRALSKVMTNRGIKGVKLEVSGRLNGTEIARKEWLKEGKLPRQTLRADIDYGESRAHCTYGTIGVKVWMYKGEKL